MTYKDFEILARVYREYSELWFLDEDGEPEDCGAGYETPHEGDMTVVWYEVDGMEHLYAMENGEKLAFVQIPSIEEAKRRIDLYRKQNPVEE